MSTPLVIGPEEKAKLAKLVEQAAAAPVHMPDVVKSIETPAGKNEHMARMTAQTIALPLAFMVTFSIETGHPCGTCRHMSMSVNRENRLPHPEGIWMVAQELGFTGALKDCSYWLETLKGHGQAVNVVQPMAN